MIILICIRWHADYPLNYNYASHLPELSRGKDTVEGFAQFLTGHQGSPKKIKEAVCDMSPAFLSGIAEQLPQAKITVYWCHIVQTFTRALDGVRKKEIHVPPLPKHVRWAVLKNGEVDHLTTNQLNALAGLLDQRLDTATAWRIKERLKWIWQAMTPRAARWRITRFISYAKAMIGDSALLEPVGKALETLGRNAERVVRRWTSTYINARRKGLNSLFQAARARARGYRNNETFIAMIYMIASPEGSILKSTLKQRRARINFRSEARSSLENAVANILRVWPVRFIKRDHVYES